ncbi:hypothetical protein BDZ97DRAFT_2054927 [Flammula alnicola]|nr:hypothetical protein BDZ97DRAFT_2054927 [Flammula alnicola]
MKDFVRVGRSNPPVDPALSIRSSPFTPRMSILPSVRLPSLRWHESDEPPMNKKPPLVTLKLSSHSFLDSSLKDDLVQDPLYQIKTVGTSTTVSRTDPRRESVKAALIKWPRVLPTKTAGKDSTDGILIQMRGTRWSGGETLLKPGSITNPARKFNIPNYSQSLKWKRYGSVYWCTTSSVKGPVAILDTTKGSERTKLIIYETLHDKYDPNTLSSYQGVSLLLLDYVLVTGLLLVTDPQDWMLVQEFEEGQSLTIPNPDRLGISSAPDLPLTSDPQLRKIMYGEPIYPKLSGTESRSKHSSSSTPPTTPGLPRTPTSSMPIFTFPESESSSSRPATPKSTLASVIGSDDNFDSFSIPETRTSSPLPESIYFSSAAPSHTYADPSFYRSQTRPPVPPLPLQYATAFNGRNFSSQPSTPVSAGFRNFRQLPHTPPADTIPRPRTSPPEEQPSLDMTAQRSSHQSRAERPSSIRSHTSNFSTSTTAAPPISASPPVARRVQSSSQLRSDTPLSPPTKAAPPRPQRSLPPTPGVGVVGNNNNTQSSEAEANTHLQVEQQHSRQPPITKASQEDLTNWVHLLTNPGRDLPPAPLPSSSIFDAPPPAYDTITFSRRPTQRRPSNSPTAAPTS